MAEAPFSRESKKSTNGWAVAFYTLLLIGSLWHALELKWPDTEFLYLYFLGLTVVGWGLRHRLRRSGIFTSLVLSSFGLALIFRPAAPRLLIFYLLVAWIPVGFYFYCRRRKTATLLVSVFFVCLMGDLLNGFHLARGVYLAKRPSVPLGVDSHLKENQLPLKRVAQSIPDDLESLNEYLRDKETVHYLSLLKRENTVFSESSKDPIKQFPTPFETAYYGTRALSFLLPKYYYELVHANFPPYVLENLFALRKSNLQFKKGLLSSSQAELIRFFKDQRQGEELLKRFLFMEPNNEFRSQVRTVPIDKAVKELGPLLDSTIEVESYKNNSVHLTVETQKAGYIYWSDGFDPEWSAHINGTKAPIFRVNKNFKAVLVKTGRSQVQFTYWPKWFMTALVFFYGAFFAACLAACLSFLNLGFLNRKLLIRSLSFRQKSAVLTNQNG